MAHLDCKNGMLLKVIPTNYGSTPRMFTEPACNTEIADGQVPKIFKHQLTLSKSPKTGRESKEIHWEIWCRKAAISTYLEVQDT